MDESYVISGEFVSSASLGALAQALEQHRENTAFGGEVVIQDEGARKLFQVIRPIAESVYVIKSLVRTELFGDGPCNVLDMYSRAAKQVVLREFLAWDVPHILAAFPEAIRRGVVASEEMLARACE